MNENVICQRSTYSKRAKMDQHVHGLLFRTTVNTSITYSVIFIMVTRIMEKDGNNFSFLKSLLNYMTIDFER